MSVQPATSLVLTQPPQPPPPGSLVLTHQPGLVLSQPEPPETIVLGHHGASVPGSFVLTQSAPQPGAIVLPQPSAPPPIGPFVPPQLVLPAGTELAMESRPVAVSGTVSEALTEFQAMPMFSQAGRAPAKVDADSRGTDVSVYHVPSGSQLTVLQTVPGQQEPVSRSYIALNC